MWNHRCGRLIVRRGAQESSVALPNLRRKALEAVANGEGAHYVGNAAQKNMLGAPAKVAGQHFSVPEGRTDG